MRTTLVLVAAAVFVFLAGWWIDDQLLNNDVPRAVSVAEVDIGDLAHDDAVKRLEEAGLADARIELRWADVSIERTAAEFGVVADVEAAVAQAEDRGSALAQPYRWARSLFVSRSIEPSFRIDRDVLASYFDTGSDAVFPLDFGRPQIELIDGVFVEVDIPQVAAVDVEALESLVLTVARDRTEGTSVIEVPTTGLAGVDLGADQLVASANDLIDHGLRVEVLGSPRSNYVSAATIEGWIRFGGTPEDPTIELDAALVQEALDAEEWGFETSGTEASFVVDDRGDVRIVAPAGVGCCAEDTTDRILAALTADDRSVDLLPDGDAEENGIVWAQSLGIEELVGEFTTYYTPGQSRVTNIQRIAELTQGVIIEPEGMFSINEYVGRRTRENGFVAAGMIVNGNFQASVGGGISQYATTLFNAAFFAGLDFGQYQSHSIYIDRYPYGREATVSFPLPNLEIVNNTPYSVLLWPTTDERSVTVRLFSTRWAVGEQTAQTEWREGVSCTRVSTERTRTFVEDGRTEVDTVTARYRPQGRACDGSSTRPTTTTTPPPTTAAPSTTTTTAATTTTTVPSTTTTAATTTTTTTVPSTTTTAATTTTTSTTTVP